MHSYKFLLDLAIILLCTKLLGITTTKVRMPQVVGALMAGLLLGPAAFGVLSETDFLRAVAELGVIVLMFSAGLETDIKELKKSGKASLVIAACGVIVPIAGGFLAASFFNKPEMIQSDASCSILLQNIFIGVILTATSVSITVETLKELGRLKTHSGNAILGAAIIDDILGIIALTIITSVADPSVRIIVVLGKVAAFFVFAIVAGFLFYKVYKYWMSNADRMRRRHVIAAFVFCLLMAYLSERLFGVADITGAYIAGLIISNVGESEYLLGKFDVASFLLLSPVFFANIGLSVTLPKMTPAIVLFTLILVIVAILTKVIGCGLGAKLCGYQTHQCKRIGVGMVSRGEVALIVASKGTEFGLLGSAFVGPVVVMVVITTIITPILLKVVYRSGAVAAVEAGEDITGHYDELTNVRREHQS
ncbi:MAG: cation:proton antiporter [Lachnospiraceae bacterium]|nr:cation:proton antiporter [Lachnospiraceae bacterium]